VTTTADEIAVDLSKYVEPMDLQSLFQRTGPVHIEIGSGKGTFLLHQAKAHPELNYLGIEWANKIYLYTVDRICRWGVDNVRVLRTDARVFIKHFLADASAAAFHIYFPDPWPKKRHHRRRFINQATVLELARCLIPGGELRLATDHADYFAVMEEVLLYDAAVSALFEKTAFLPTDAADEGEWVGSNFERKYQKEGRRTYTLAVRKR